MVVEGYFLSVLLKIMSCRYSLEGEPTIASRLVRFVKKHSPFEAVNLHSLAECESSFQFI